jgi:hypothetical protein
MTIRIPFCYKAVIIKPKFRKPMEVIVQDSITVKIKEFSKTQLPIAFIVGKEKLLYDSKSLWMINYDKDIDSKELNTVNSNTVVENTEKGGENYKYSCSSPSAPFLNFWWEAKCLLEDKKVVPTKKELENACRWVSDNRNEIIKKIKEVTSNLIFCDDILYKKSNEPMYVVQTFGIGHNYSVALFSTYILNSNIDTDSYYNALNLEEAKIDAFKRFKDANIYADIEVLIPEAVKFKNNNKK